jgi:hypothetical protein
MEIRTSSTSSLNMVVIVYVFWNSINLACYSACLQQTCIESCSCVLLEYHQKGSWPNFNMSNNPWSFSCCRFGGALNLHLSFNFNTDSNQHESPNNHSCEIKRRKTLNTRIASFRILLPIMFEVWSRHVLTHFKSSIDHIMCCICSSTRMCSLILLWLVWEKVYVIRPNYMK